jgi:hypothetical protein
MPSDQVLKCWLVVSIVLAFTMATLTCAVCLDAPKRPVVTRCGHLMCWECLRQWARQERASNRCGQQVRCPVCKGGIDPDNNTDVRPILGVEDHGPPPAAQPSPPKPSMGGNAPSERTQPPSPTAVPPRPEPNPEPPQPDRAPEPQRNGGLQNLGILFPFLFVAWSSDWGTEMLPAMGLLLLVVALASLARWLARGGHRRGIQNPFRGANDAFWTLLFIGLPVALLLLLASTDPTELLGLHPSSWNGDAVDEYTSLTSTRSRATQTADATSVFGRGHATFGPQVTIR